MQPHVAVAANVRPTYLFSNTQYLGWMLGGSNSGESEIFRHHPDRPWGPKQPPVQCVLVLSRK